MCAQGAQLRHLTTMWDERAIDRIALARRPRRPTQQTRTPLCGIQDPYHCAGRPLGAARGLDWGRDQYSQALAVHELPFSLD